MELTLIDTLGAIVIVNRSEPMPAHAVALSVNPSDLAERMGISLEALSSAVHVPSEQLRNNPRNPNWQPKLEPIIALWDEMVTLFGTEQQARKFLVQKRPELQNQPPLYYLENAQLEVVANLVNAMREMLP